jgi:imidazolonepropionase-like amidohydrolase
VPIGAGTDTPIGYALPGFSLHTELEYLVEAGLTPIEALYAATIRPTEFFSIENEMGTIDVGKVADMVLLDANPIENISNTRQINLVVSKGAVILPAELL